MRERWRLPARNATIDAEVVENARMSHDEMLSRIEARFENRQAAERWYRGRPLSGFSGLTAEQMVEQGRAIEVVEYVEAVDAGVFS